VGAASGRGGDRVGRELPDDGERRTQLLDFSASLLASGDLRTEVVRAEPSSAAPAAMSAAIELPSSHLRKALEI
jgi:hypothetical protein